MTFLLCIACTVIASVTVRRITRERASAEMSRLQAQMAEEIRRLQQETNRAKVRAAQLARDADTRASAWKEGRDDVIAIMPLIASAREGGAGLRRAAQDVIETM